MPKSDVKAAGKRPRIKPVAFGERPGLEPYNASEIVAIGDSRLLFCDNNIGDALFELNLAADGSMAAPLLRRPLQGLDEGAADDLEGMTHVHADGASFLVAAPSYGLKKRKRRRKKKSKRGKECPSRSGLLRIRFGADERLEAEMVAGFRDWLAEHAPLLGRSPRWLPDDGGLNVEGLSWSAAERALLLGLRTPVVEGRPVILRVRINDLDGPWTLDNFQMLPPVLLEADGDGEEQGIRSIGSDPGRGEWLIVLGNTTSDSKAPFSLCAWDGNAEGRVRRFDKVRFGKRMKVEGVTHATVAGRGAIVFVDDGGGYQVLWDDDPRLR